ncbi:MAG: hypothetical protein QW182_03575 [Thermosphaera sp.]
MHGYTALEHYVLTENTCSTRVQPEAPAPGSPVQGLNHGVHGYY